MMVTAWEDEQVRWVEPRLSSLSNLSPIKGKGPEG